MDNRDKIKIAVVGTGYVGLSISMLLAQKNKVVALDIDKQRVSDLHAKISPIHDTEIQDFLINKDLDFRVTLNKREAYLEADYVIVTVPLGVLKKGVIEFSPALPQNKLDAIAALDMGILNKVYLHFDEVFWDNNVTNIAKISEQKGHWAYWINLAPATGKPILTAFNVASFGKEIEEMTDEQIIAKAMEALQTMYGNDIGQPTDHLITRWGKDEFSYGSYSYIPKGASASMRDDLAEPVDGKVLFAGEATHSEHPSTVHGAFLSGEREADRVIALAGG